MKISIKLKIISGISSILLVMIALLIIVMTNLNDVKNEQNKISKEIVPNTVDFLELELSIVHIQQWFSDISATQAKGGFDDGLKEAEKSYNNSIKITNHLISVHENEPEVLNELKKMKINITNYYDVGKELANAYIKGGPELGNKYMKSFDEAAEKLHKILDHFVDEHKSELKVGSKNILAKTESIEKTTIILFGILFLIALMVTYIIIKSVKPVKKLTDNFVALAKGDLDLKPIHVKTKDELGILAKTFNNLIISFNELIGQVKSSVGQVSAGAGQVSSASQNLSSGAAEQASSLEQITSSATEINGQAKQNAENAIQAKALAEKAKENAEVGNSQMKELVDGMDKINKSSEEIKKIINVIDDIAFQTNLLALNANVEAARAGKFGKGFAVVAEEVRNLAVRSAGAVKETSIMIEETILNISSGNELVSRTANQLEEISNVILKVADLISEITAASKEQSLGLDQVNTGLNQIEQVTQNTSSSAEESAAASEELASQADQLRGIVEKFKLRKSEIKENHAVIESVNSDVLQKLREEIERDIMNNINQKNINEKSNISRNINGQNNNSKKISPEELINLKDNNFENF